MAGAGVRLFTAGQILTASQVNEYLQDQVVSRFSDAADRDASFGGVGEPSLSEGRICYLDSDDTVYIYNGTAWVAIQSGISGTAGQAIVYNSSGTPVAQTLTGDVTINSSAVTAISSNSIVNADINSAAGIALSKLASATAGQIVVHNGSGVPTATTMSGDITIDSAGITTIGTEKIVNADINASAAIALSKLASGSPAQVVIANASGVPTYTTISGDVSINNAGVASLTATDVTVSNIKTTSTIETLSISATAAGGTVNLDMANGTTYYTSNSTSNFTVNLRWNSSTSLNTRLAVGEMVTTTFMVTNGATAVLGNAYQIAGTPITPRWQGGTAPTAGNANSVDMYTYTVVKTAANTFSLFAVLTRFA